MVVNNPYQIELKFLHLEKTATVCTLDTNHIPLHVIDVALLDETETVIQYHVYVKFLFDIGEGGHLINKRIQKVVANNFQQCANHMRETMMYFSHEFFLV